MPQGDRVLITGAGGMIAGALRARLSTRPLRIDVLSRRAEAGGLVWSPEQGVLEASDLEGFEAVVHLAGANLAQGRWTAARRRELRRSRVDATRLLITRLGQTSRPPRVIVSASAAGYYGDTGDTDADEASPAGSSFLAELCRAWEDEALAATAFGARVVLLRSGVVLSHTGGALAKMLPLFRLGLGGRLGSGRQWMSWIALDDLLRLIELCLSDSALSGPFNAVSPHPVRNAEFAATLATVLGRPATIPVPATALHVLFGHMARETLLSSSRVVPARLLTGGYAGRVFRLAELDAALEAVLRQQ